MADHIFELVERLDHSTNWEDQQRALLAALKVHGYDTFVVGVVPSLKRNMQSEAVLAQNMNPDWINIHDARGYGQNASVEHCLRYNTPLLWSEMLKNAQKGTNEKELELNIEREKYYIGGVSIPLWTQWSPYRFGMSLTSSNKRSYEDHDEMFKRDRNTILIICRLFFSYANWREIILTHYHLTDRNVKVFGSLLRGRSRKEVAHEFGTSQHTIKYHMQTVARKFGVQTNEQAIIKFALLGLTKFDQ